MDFHHPTASIYIPDNVPEAEAFKRITHLGIGAHQDDLEFMAFHGIIACYDDPDKWFGGVTCTNGSGSARTGAYASYSDEEMMKVRRVEQDKAADIGRYGVMVQLDYPSCQVKDPHNTALADDLQKILLAARPDVVYTHNLADKHDTHIGIVISTLNAIRALPPERRPEKVYGCEVWRDLDWMPDEDKVAFNVSGHERLAVELNGLFASQIAGGKRYDLAIQGRRRANATFFESHATDEAERLCFAMDLSPLVRDDESDIVEYVHRYLKRFADDVTQKLKRQLGRQNGGLE